MDVDVEMEMEMEMVNPCPLMLEAYLSFFARKG